MSVRGIQFLNQWLSENIPNDAWPDRVQASELADRVLVAAEKSGIPAREIDEEVRSVFASVLSAMTSRHAITSH
ncbi:DUF768 domain-containing protein [Mesorhizobium sp. ASY16-5R]|uniref:DUF768 domain-containing protein n=1 Tax=Mesorhizobium sp. ASY16-5R TaxID=3445772 RepID=UPI003FA16085